MVPFIPIREWESKSALLAHLEDRKAQGPLVGQSAEAPRAYYSFSITSAQPSVEVGIISSGLGSKPAAVLVDKDRRLIVGHDTFVSWIDVEHLRIISSRRLGGVFFEFLPIDRDDEIVVIHELGAQRLDANGLVKWSVDTDILEGWLMDGHGNLLLTAMDGAELVVSLATGVTRRSNGKASC